VLGSGNNAQGDGGADRINIALSLAEERITGRLALTVPAKPEAVRVVRAVMRTWAASAGIVLDEIEELCLAIDEAFAGLIAARPAPKQVIVRIRASADGVDIIAVRDADAELWPPVSAQTALVRRVLSTLIDDVRFEITDEGPAIHLIKHRATLADVPPRT
jgi:hypothetical protein